MSYYCFNRQEILQEAKESHSKEKAAEYYLQNKEAIKEQSQESVIKSSRKKKKTRLRSKKKSIKNWFSIKKRP